MKKGFTLIELLAVILILGIIALIAIPTINNIIEQSKIGAFKSSISNIERAVIQNCEAEQLKGTTLTKKYIFTDNIVTPKIAVKGELPKNGVIILNDDCDVKAYFSNDNMAFSKNYKDNDYASLEQEQFDKIMNVYLDGTLVYFNPTTGISCKSTDDVQIGTGKKAGCMKWYIFNDEKGNDTVNMILEHNSHTNKSYAGLPTTISNIEWVSGLNIRAITLDEYKKILGSESLNKVEADGYSKFAWLYNYTMDNSNKPCTESKYCKYADSSSGGYWLGTFNGDRTDMHMTLTANGISARYNVDVSVSFRPVITISKTLISNN